MNEQITPQPTAPSTSEGTFAALETKREKDAARLAELEESLAYVRAELAYREAHFLRLTALVQQMLPTGISVPDSLCMPGITVPRHTTNHATLKRLAAKAAVEDAEIGYSLSIEAWVAYGVQRLRKRFDANEDRSERLVLDALTELHDATATVRCVVFRIKLKTDRTPPDWETLSSLLEDNPGLVENGLQEMANRGFVAPPWLTAAVS